MLLFMTLKNWWNGWWFLDSPARIEVLEVTLSPVKAQESRILTSNVEDERPYASSFARTSWSSPSPQNMFDEMHRREASFFALPPVPEGYDDTFVRFVKSEKVCERITEEDEDDDEDEDEEEPIPLLKHRPNKSGKSIKAKLTSGNETSEKGSEHSTSSPIPIPKKGRKLPLY